MLIVIALGGNAVSLPGKEGNIADQFAAARHERDDGWQVREDPANRGWRRVVPSPLPRDIIELPLLRELVKAGQIVIAAGGGGIPVMRDSHGNFRGVEAVIDKDRTSAILAAELGADVLVILTNVETVQRDFGKPTAKPMDRMTVVEAKSLI